MVSSGGPWAVPMEILVPLPFTAALCTTLLYFPLITINNIFKSSNIDNSTTKKSYLHMITDVDYDRVRQGIDRNPLSLVHDLEASKVVLDEESQEAIIGMRRQPHCDFWLWAWSQLPSSSARSGR
ncbi:hypothetical protein GH714_026039 [Hevea brasiliensis]|uniref:Uncharacterized protein n=1 Tax=Hevea brasiliensis TaxID=3981 RepID=A0A6A6KVX7_HEVBR|nr:hypothetical protein GH714_026039 [Hevea brasiliensis]